MIQEFYEGVKFHSDDSRRFGNLSCDLISGPKIRIFKSMAIRIFRVMNYNEIGKCSRVFCGPY